MDTAADTNEQAFSIHPACHFWKLPIELRVNIYQDVLQDLTISAKDEDKCVTPPIMQVCRTIYHESKQKYTERLAQLSQDAKERLDEARQKKNMAHKEVCTLLTNKSWARYSEALIVFDASNHSHTVIMDRTALEMRKVVRAAGVDPDKEVDIF